MISSMINISGTGGCPKHNVKNQKGGCPHLFASRREATPPSFDLWLEWYSTSSQQGLHRRHANNPVNGGGGRFSSVCNDRSGQTLG